MQLPQIRYNTIPKNHQRRLSEKGPQTTRELDGFKKLKPLTGNLPSNLGELTPVGRQAAVTVECIKQNNLPCTRSRILIGRKETQRLRAKNSEYAERAECGDNRTGDETQQLIYIRNGKTSPKASAVRSHSNPTLKQTWPRDCYIPRPQCAFEMSML